MSRFQTRLGGQNWTGVLIWATSACGYLRGGICRRRLLPPVFLLQGIVNLANGRVFLVRSRLKWRVSAAMAQRRLTLPGWLRVVLTDFGKRGFTFGMWLPVF